MQFAGTEFSYPLTDEQLKGYLAAYPDRAFYLGLASGIPIFFGEIIPAPPGPPRLGRLLVGEPSKRGRGLGVLFTRLLMAECRRLLGAERVELYVWEENAAAIRCYKKAGFEFLDLPPYRLEWNGSTYVLLKMQAMTEDAKMLSLGNKL